MLLTLVVVHDFDFVGVSGAPFEADPVLVVDPDAVLTLSIPPKSLQPETWQNKILKRRGRIQQFQPDSG